MTDADVNLEALAAMKKEPTFTGEDLGNMVLDHMLDNPELFVPSKHHGNDRNGTTQFIQMLDSMKELARKVAVASMANRHNLSTLPVLGNHILADPEQTDDQNQYEVRFRLVEQYGANPPTRDVIHTYDEAVEIYGTGFVEKYWGTLGEKCPSLVTTGQDRQIWFTAVRYPVANQELDHQQLMDSLEQATQPFGSTPAGDNPDTKANPESGPSQTGQRQRTAYKAPSLR